MGHLTDEIVYIAARESVGKTAFAVQMAVQMGFFGIRVAFASLESKRQKLVQRMIAQIGRVNTLDLKFKHGSPSALSFGFQRAREAGEKIKDLPIAIEDCGMNIDQIRAFAQMEKARGARLLIVDNMKHIRHDGKSKSTTEQFRELALGLKWMRDDLDMPVIVLHHLNKDGDVSWSDDIRRDADVLLFLEVDEKASRPYKPPDWTGQTIINVKSEKAREGRRGFQVQAEFLPHHQTFIEHGEPQQEEPNGPV